MTLAEHQEEYQPLPVLLLHRDPRGRAFSKWKLGLRERIKILFTGRPWLMMMTFHHPPMPILPTVDKSFRREK